MIDLSALPPPLAVEPLSAATIRDAMLTAFNAAMLDQDPDWTDIGPSDPAYRLIEVFAYRELMLRQRVNDAVKAVLIATSTGADLAQLVALLDVDATGLTDQRVRSAWFDALHQLSTAGPAGAYRGLARTVPGIRDAIATRPSAGLVRVILLAEFEASDGTPIGNGTPTTEQVAAVQALLSDEDRRPLTDTVESVAATIVEYAIVARVQLEPDPGPDRTAVIAEAQASAVAYAKQRRSFGRAVTLDTLKAALVVPGVERVFIDSLTEDVITSEHQVPYAAAVTVTEAT